MYIYFSVCVCLCVFVYVYVCVCVCVCVFVCVGLFSNHGGLFKLQFMYCPVFSLKFLYFLCILCIF